VQGVFIAEKWKMVASQGAVSGVKEQTRVVGENYRTRAKAAGVDEPQ